MILSATDRLFPESEDRFRTAYQRDRDRIIHSRSFRRLKHKTQVFVAPQYDHYRTRLTHTIEVAQIARTLAIIFKADFDADEYLTEAIALGHDLGHPPFGHAGEKTLSQKMQDAGHSNGFDHNIQTLRVMSLLEKRNPKYYGLNLSKAVIEGTVKHSFPIGKITSFYERLSADYQIDLNAPPMIEAQIAGIADDIAYNHHDMDDGIRAGVISFEMLQDILPFTRSYLTDIFTQTDDESLMIHMLVGRLINDTVTDLANQQQSFGKGVLVFSAEMAVRQKMQKAFLKKYMYHNERIMAENQQGGDIISQLFDKFVKDVTQLPPEWQAMYQQKNSKRVIADYIAGMTDGFATKLCQKIKG